MARMERMVRSVTVRTLHSLAHAAADSTGASLPDACSGASRLPTSASTASRMGVQHARKAFLSSGPRLLHSDCITTASPRSAWCMAIGRMDGEGGVERGREQGSVPLAVVAANDSECSVA
jgi:hypothetical protein